MLTRRICCVVLFAVILAGPGFALDQGLKEVVNGDGRDWSCLTIIESDDSTDLVEASENPDNFTIELDYQPFSDITVTVQGDSQVDLGAGAGTAVELIFTPDNWYIAQTVAVWALDDQIAQGPHLAIITISALGHPDEFCSASGPMDVTANISDNDVAGIAIVESGQSTDVQEAGPITDSYTIVLTSQPVDEVTIEVNPANAQIDLGAGAGASVSLAFTAANWDTAQTVTVIAVDDDIVEGLHTCIISHSVSSSDPNYHQIAAADVTANITDDDVAGVAIVESGQSTDVQESGPITDNYTIALTSQPVDEVTVEINPANAQIDLGAGAGASISLAFTAANWDTAQAVTVAGVDDDIVEGPHTCIISHSVSSSDPNYHQIAAADVTANITDDDVAGVAIVESGQSTNVHEAGLTWDNYTIVLDSEPSAEVVVTISPEDQVDVGAGAGTSISQTFTPSNWSIAQTATVIAVGDGIVEGMHTSTISHSVSSSDPNYDQIVVSHVLVNITEDDPNSSFRQIKLFVVSPIGAFDNISNIGDDNQSGPFGSAGSCLPAGLFIMIGTLWAFALLLFDRRR